jgi:hypothetical protein
MASTSAKVLLWSPRTLALMMTAFLSLFAFDAFSEGRPPGQALVAFIIHLAPAAMVLAVVAWRWEWVGALAFIALAAVYANMVRHRFDWILLISGPLVIIGVMYLWAWWKHDELHVRL